MRVSVLFFGVVFAFGLGTDGALAQDKRPKIWDIKLGIPTKALPLEEFVEPACGTNGGPPSRPIETFDNFARCPVEEATGLHEIWFIYEDELEYVARADRDERMIGRASANVFFSQPIITSLLIDRAGLVQGYRVVTDQRAPAQLRIDADSLYDPFMGMFDYRSWVCAAQPPMDGERPILGRFVKDSCRIVSEERYVRLETRHYYRPGQDIRVRPRLLEEAANDFESSTRLEVYNIAAVRGAPCCPASARP